MFSAELLSHAKTLLELCKSKHIKIATSESCTGGLIAALLTEIPGSSDVFERGFVTYSNASKTVLLGVEESLIKMHGAVSEAVANAMAMGAKTRTGVDLAVGITGIAGPGGGTPQKPVGTVCIAVACGDGANVQTFHFTGNRHAVRMASVGQALALMEKAISSFVYVA